MALGVRPNWSDQIGLLRVLVEPVGDCEASSSAGLVRYFLDLQEDDFESHVAQLACDSMTRSCQCGTIGDHAMAMMPRHFSLR